MKTNISDIFDALPGDKIVLDKNVTVIADVYAEAIANHKWVSVDSHLINPTWIVEILNPDSLRNVDITNQIVGSDFYGLDDDGRMILQFPDHINVSSLQSRIYAKCKGYSVKFFDNNLILTKRIATFNTGVIMDEFRKGDVKTIGKKECVNLKSTITSLYKIASDHGITVSIKNSAHSIIVTHKSDVSCESELPFAARLRHWLKDLPYDMTVDIPERFTSVKSMVYINNVFGQSKYTCKVGHGRVTKRSGALRKRMGAIEVVVYEKVIKVINKPSLTNISKRDRTLINLVLKPYNKTYEDVR